MSDVGVMHELLFALLGYTGGLVVETPEGFTLAPQSFITEGERQLLEKTLKVGFYCKKLSDFTATLRRRHFANAGTETTSPGHYAYGLAVRIESALEKFREKVLELEDEVLEKPSLPLAYLLAKLEEDTVLLGVLHRLMTQVTTRSLRGAVPKREEETVNAWGALLDLLWQAVACAGGPSLQRCLAEQLEGAGQVWVNQLVAWMVYGRLADPDHEFFVQRLDTSDQRSVEDLSLPGEALQEWHHLFQLREEAVPRTVITRNAAEKVLFTGKAVRVLIRSHCWSGQEEHLQRHVDTLRSCFSCKSPCNVLERCIGELKENANAQLLELLKRSRLVQTLQAMKGFYLLGYGAFYQTLLDVEGTSPQALLDGWEKALAEMESTATGASARDTSSAVHCHAVRLQLVPRSVDLHSFDDENVKVMGGRLENGLVLMSPRSMVWLQTKVRISSSFQHVFNFQLRPKHRGGSAASTASRAFGEYGTRLALCFQPNRRLQEIVEPLETWRSLGECLAVEVTYCVLPHL
ncbi:Gamma-tubulin complex component 4 homolog [Durusdinium trenchii]|uniref:Spindle pole body component n=1 Tax=Durusdinium trenchii TaxID=1381693 RepID=A0ABP0PW00_9DINO